MDDTVPLEPVGIAGYRDEIINPNAEVILVDDPMRNGHSSIFRSVEALDYLDALNREYRQSENQLGREFSEEERKAFFANIDKFKVNELDESLFQQIEAFFSDAIGQ